MIFGGEEPNTPSVEVRRGGRRGVKKTCRCRHVKKICRWHIFNVDLSGYAAVASILVCTASSFSLRLRRLYPVAVPKISLRHLSRRNFDRCHSFAALYLPPAAHGSLPAAASILSLKALSFAGGPTESSAPTKLLSMSLPYTEREGQSPSPTKRLPTVPCKAGAMCSATR